GLALVNQFGFHGTFLGGLAFSVIALGLSYFLSFPRHSPTASQHQAKWRLRASDIVDSRAIGFLTVIFIVGVCFSGILVFLNAHTQDLGLGSTSASFFLIFAVTVLIARTF